MDMGVKKDWDFTDVSQESDVEGNHLSFGIESQVFHEWLETRRISLKTADAFQLKLNLYESGVIYPVTGTPCYYRQKNFDGTIYGKYNWLPNRPGDDIFYPYYHLANLSQSITENGGACWLVSGESDVWAMHSAGIHAVLSSGYTERTVPRDLAANLISLGVSLVSIAPDLDQTGKNWAQKVVDRLNGCGIEVDIRRLPETLGEKGDLGKAWVQYSRPGISFESWLLGLER